MSGVNKVILIGNLGSDPEVRHLSNGSVVANFNIATSESYNNKNGERVTQTEWHRIELWEGLAKIAEQYLKKGSTIYIEGRIRTETWQDKDGNTRTTTRIKAQNMTMLGGKPTTNQETTPYNKPYVQPQTPPDNQQAAGIPETKETEGETDDLPF